VSSERAINWREANIQLERTWRHGWKGVHRPVRSNLPDKLSALSGENNERWLFWAAPWLKGDSFLAPGALLARTTTQRRTVSPETLRFHLELTPFGDSRLIDDFIEPGARRTAVALHSGRYCQWRALHWRGVLRRRCGLCKELV
jgi:hypothetical protein